MPIRVRQLLGEESAYFLRMPLTNEYIAMCTRAIFAQAQNGLLNFSLPAVESLDRLWWWCFLDAAPTP